MYKVFIENTPIFILHKKEFSSQKGIIVNIEKIKDVKNVIFNWISSDKTKTPIYIIHSNPNKIFTHLFKDFDYIEAAGGIVVRKNTYLFIKRNGFWDIPKGKIEKNENPEEGAVREIEEECGILNPKIEKFICETYHTYFYKGRPTLKKTFWYSLEYEGNKKVKPQLEEGITKVKWLKKDEIEKIEKNTFASIKEVISNFFQ